MVVVVVVSSSRVVYISGNSSSVLILQKLDVRTELVVDCIRAGLKKKAGGRGGAQPPPHLQTYSLSRQEKALKRECGVLMVAITTVIH